MRIKSLGYEKQALAIKLQNNVAKRERIEGRLRSSVSCASQEAASCAQSITDLQYSNQPWLGDGNDTCQQDRLWQTARAAAESDLVEYLHNPVLGTDVFLVGTVHISPKSAEQVQRLIESIRPDTVFVELCSKRSQSVARGDASKPGKGLQDFFGQALGSIKDGKIPNFIALYTKLAVTQFYEQLKDQGMKPGQEFEVAIQEAKAVGADVVYGDLPTDQIFSGVQSALSLDTMVGIGRFALMPEDPNMLMDLNQGDVDSSVELLKQRSRVRKLFGMFQRELPDLHHAIITKRDKHMVNGLLNLQNKRVVAVVGVAHMDGMVQYWNEIKQKMLDIDRRNMLRQSSRLAQ